MVENVTSHKYVDPNNRSSFGACFPNSGYSPHHTRTATGLFLSTSSSVNGLRTHPEDFPVVLLDNGTVFSASAAFLSIIVSASITVAGQISFSATVNGFLDLAFLSL